jgi:hypothetical protein
MPEEALRATDAIHRQIEALFHKYDLYYDRRKGHYRDQGKPVDQIVSVVDVLQAMLAIVLKRPDDARARPRNYFKNTDHYLSVFGTDKYNLNLYLKSVSILRHVEIFLDDKALDLIHRRNLVYYLCLYATCVKVGSAYAPPGDILKMDISTLSPDLLTDCLDRLRKIYEKSADKLFGTGEREYDSLAKGSHLLKAVNSELKRRFNTKKKTS